MTLHGKGRCLIVLLCLLIAVPLIAVAGPADSYHDDHRQTPRLQFEPAWRGSVDTEGEALARAFVADRARTFGVADPVADLVLRETRESLVGIHYHFQQVIDGYDVLHGEVIVSVARADGRVYQAYNNFYPVDESPRAAASLTAEEAYDMAWNRLRAQGGLLSSPACRLVWVPEGAGFNLSYLVDLEPAVPYGGWRAEVDAVTGEIRDLRDIRRYRVRDELTDTPVDERIAAHAGVADDRHAAFARFAAQNDTAGERDGVRADGVGKVFDPDPRTTLQNAALQNTSPASSFTSAYFDRPLRDIQFTGATYRLTGPWVQIVNWDPPSTAPSTTTDGVWDAVRGDNSFNDAMTYYMLDTSQRYIQSLGFTGATGIQEGSIQADADGCNGADNSYYIPSTNRLAYGHGCVDDNEDADVILHEYGHAIHRSINSNWNGGDTGAMGEGFGDYWAGSYSYSTPNGPSFHPEWVFSWDGHGNGNLCWSGRLMNRTNLVYNHSTYYQAHQSIAGGVSDELWSTPLFQSLVAITDAGGTRESVDRIILESHFGIGYAPKMRDLANATVAAASALEPYGQHAAIFRGKFAGHGILDDLTGIDDGAPTAPVALSRNHPNPFNPTTEIAFSVGGEGMEIALEVFDVAGRKVRTLADGFWSAGEHAIVWDGTDDRGADVVSGVYFYRLAGDGFSRTRKMTLLK